MPGAAKPYWVYVLFSDSGRRFYIGITEDVQARLALHSAGQSRWTRRHAPWRCVYQIRMDSLTEARKFENLLKRQKAGDGFYALTGLEREQFGRGRQRS